MPPTTPTRPGSWNGSKSLRLSLHLSLVSTLCSDLLPRLEDPTKTTLNSGFEYSYGVDYGTLRWISFLDPPRGLGGQPY